MLNPFPPFPTFGSADLKSLVVTCLVCSSLHLTSNVNSTAQSGQKSAQVQSLLAVSHVMLKTLSIPHLLYCIVSTCSSLVSGIIPNLSSIFDQLVIFGPSLMQSIYILHKQICLLPVDQMQILNMEALLCITCVPKTHHSSQLN